MKTLNVVGCGKVGQTLARLWTEHHVWEVRSVLNRSYESGLRAAKFVGGGHAAGSYAQMENADVVMIAASDRSIEPCCRRLCEAGLVQPGAVVFHCSGSLPSTVLEPARSRGASIASIHPVKSFADPAAAVETFAGTFCALEGDEQACEVLADALRRAGAITFSVAPQRKMIYHAGTVMVCNYLVALAEVGLRCFEMAGLPRESALKLIEPIASGTIRNLCELGPVRALTGPIARGEPLVVQRQLEALGRCDEKLQRVYRCLGQVAVELAAAQGTAGADALAAIEQMLQCKRGP